MARRFAFLTDVQISKDLVQALEARGYAVQRVVMLPELGEQASDANILEYAAAHGLVWLTRDEKAQGELKRRRERGLAMPGVVCWSQRYRTTMSIGDVLRQIEALEQEGEPFLQGMRYLKPGR